MNVSEMTYFVSGGTEALTQSYSMYSINALIKILINWHQIQFDSSAPSMPYLSDDCCLLRSKPIGLTTAA